MRTTTGAVAPEADTRGVLVLLRDTLASGAVDGAGTGIHHFLICVRPHRSIDRIRSHAAARGGHAAERRLSTVGLAISIEDVTERLERERGVARAARLRIPTFADAIEESARAALTTGTLGRQWATKTGRCGAPRSVRWRRVRDPELLHAIVTRCVRDTMTSVS